MKTPVVLLSIVCVALAAALFLRHNKAQRALDSAAKQSETSSNEVSQLRTKLALAEGMAAQTQTNLQGLLDKRTAELINASNIVVQTRAMLASAQEETAKAQSELQTRAERIGALEAQRDDLVRRGEDLPRLEKQLAETRKSLVFALGDRDTAVKESQGLQLENADLQRKLTDLQFLRWQTERVKADIDAAKYLAKGKPGRSPDFRLPITMLADGTVQLVPPASLESTK
jgi:hypothetical protein